VPEDDRNAVPVFVVIDMQVGPADSGGRYLNQYFPVTWPGFRDVDQFNATCRLAGFYYRFDLVLLLYLADSL